MKLIKYMAMAWMLVSMAQCTPANQVAAARAAQPATQAETVQDDRRVTSMFIDAQKEKLLGNYGKAMELFQKSILRDSRHAPSYYEMARILQIQLNLSEAVKMAKKATEIDPDNEWYTLLLAQLYQATGQNALATQCFITLQQKHPANLTYSYELANIYMKMNRYASAIEVMNKIESQIGISEEISLQKQKLYILSNNLKDAIAETEKLSAAFPRESQYYNMLAELHLSNNEPAKALSYYNKVLEMDPGNPYIRISLAEFYWKTQKPEQAYQELLKGFENPRLDVDSKVRVLVAFYNINQPNEDEKVKLTRLSEILGRVHPEDVNAQDLIAYISLRDNRYQEARELYKKITKLDKNRYPAWESLMRLNLHLGMFDSLASDSRKAIELFPLQPMPYYFAGISAYQRESYNEAISLFNSGKDLVVDDNELASEFYMYLGDSYHRTQNYQSADLAYETSLSFNPDNAYVLNNFSYYLSLRKTRLDDAERMARRANELSPDNKYYLDTYGWVMYQKGNYIEAQKWIRRSLDLDDKPNAEVLEHYGDVLFRLGKTDEALDYWEKAIEVGGGSDLLEKKIKDRMIYE